MMKKSVFILAFGVGAVALVTSGIWLLTNESNSWLKPTNEEYAHEEEYDEEEFQKKIEPWTAQNALNHQKQLAKTRSLINTQNRAPGDAETYGALKGRWYNKAPRNMPGAFKFAEMLDGTDTIYGVTHNHYSGEFNSKSYIFKGTIYNPKTGEKGDDFVRLTGHWPNRYSNLIVHKFNGKTRLIAGIENGPVYYSDNDGQDWTMATGLPASLKSTIINRQDERVYATDGGAVYVSTNGGVSFSLLQSIGSVGDGSLYSPRYDAQPDAEKVYFAREGSFYELNGAKTSFTYKGAYSGAHGNSAFSIGGDSRKLYVTENKSYWVSTNGGASWTQKYPKGNWYGDRSGAMSAGKFLAVSPVDPNHVMGGYAQPVFSTDGLNTDNSTNSGWGSYQNGGGLGLEDYIDRIRFNYHPDFQAQHFFYNSTRDLFSVGCTDGGLYMSYKVWSDHPCALIYRHNIFTGYKDPNHIVFSTQDQGTQDYIMGTTGDTINVYQTIGGDGPPLNSADGNWVWNWKRQGSEVWIPEELYDGSGNRKKIGTVSNACSANNSVTFTQSTRVGWVQSYIDRDAPDKRIWMLNRYLCRATVSGTAISGTTVSKGTGHQVCAFTQSKVNPDVVYFLQEGKVYKSANRGDSFDNGTTTPFSKTSNNQNIGNGWVLPGNDNWILFAGPSANGVGAILSKDGGASWTDVTGNFPSGDDFQVGGMVGTPDGQYVFAGTDLGLYVFDVASETWSPMFGGEAAMFNTMGVEYIESINTIRFGTWGTGIWDFVIDDGTPTLTIATVSNAENCDSLRVSWSTNVEDAAQIQLLKGGSVEETWNISDAQDGYFAWGIGSGVTQGSDYTVEITVNGLTKASNAFSIGPKTTELLSTRLTVDYVDNEHSNDRLASFTVDNNTSSFWHTEWSPGTPGFPHTIVYQSDTTAEWAGFSYLPRQDGSSNGRVKDYEIYGSNDNSTWTLLKAGTLSNIGTVQQVSFDQTMESQFIKFEMLSEQNGNFYASMSEFGLFYAESCDDVTSSKEIGVTQVKVFPTMVDKGGVVSISGYEGGIDVFNLAGQKVLEGIVKNTSFKLSLGNLPTGTYILKSVGSNSVQEKIMVK